MSADFLSHPHFQALPLSSKSHKLLFPLSIVYGPLALKEEGGEDGGGNSLPRARLPASSKTPTFTHFVSDYTRFRAHIIANRHTHSLFFSLLLTHAHSHSLFGSFTNLKKKTDVT